MGRDHRRVAPGPDALAELDDLAGALRLAVEAGQPASIVTATAADLARHALDIARAAEINAAALDNGRG